MDFSDPLEDDDDDLIVEITDPKEIEKLQYTKEELQFFNPGIPNIEAFDDEEEYEYYLDQFLKREKIWRQKHNIVINK